MVDVPLLIFRAPQVACIIGSSLLVGRVLHSAEPRTLQVCSTTGNSLLVDLYCSRLKLKCWILYSLRCQWCEDYV
eukprot:8300079-Pyramimonas_sp.AAC.1